MATITTSTSLFNPELVKEVFTNVQGHSALAKLSNETPISFVGNDHFVFSMDGEASIVGEGASKPAGEAAVKAVTITPIKFVYQHRLTDEFVKMSEEQQIPYLQAFTEGFAKKMARALDIAAMHGVNPADGTAVAALADKNFDMDDIGTVTLTSGSEDDALDSAAAAITSDGKEVTGIAMSPAMGTALGQIKDKNGVSLYPEYRFGQNPSAFFGMKSDINSTVSLYNTADYAIVGDFANAFKWGYAENVPCEVIEYGDPDGLGDLKRQNQIVLRAEAYIGWGILDTDSFKRVISAE